VPAWRLTADRWTDELLTSAAVLLASYVAARLVELLVERIVTRSAPVSPPSLVRRLAVAWRHPSTLVLFLVGAWAAVHRLPLPVPWLRRFDHLLFVTGVLLLSYALLRGFSVLMSWYVDVAETRGDAHVMEFAPLLNKLGRLFIVLLATITVLQQLGVNVASLVVSLGVGSLAVGLAAQDTLSNMFAGFTLLLDRPFRVGDRIQLATGEIGDVQRVGLRSTQIRTFEESLLVVPNSLLVRDRLVNQSRPSRAAVARVNLRVAYGTDLGRVRELAEGCTRDNPDLDHERPVQLLVTAFGDIGVDLLLVFHVTDYTRQAAARSVVMEALHRGLEEAGISVPVVTAGGRDRTRLPGPSGRPAC
jgi:MscS family membrane protein